MIISCQLHITKIQALRFTAETRRRDSLVWRATALIAVSRLRHTGDQWGLRDYGTGVWIGGESTCEHRVGGQVQDNKAPGAITTVQRPGIDSSRCRKCGAVRKDQQLGLERTHHEYVERLVDVLMEVHRVLRPDGTLWLNLGDSYATGAGKVGDCPGGGEQGERWKQRADFYGGHRGSRGGSAKQPQAGASVGPLVQPNRLPIPGLKPKDLVGIPWRCAFALQAAGWYLRSDIIWAKPASMPESVQDRPTRSHEYIFLLAKSEKYFYDAEAIKEPASKDTHARYQRGRSDTHKWADGGPGNQSIAKSFAHMRKNGVHPKAAEPGSGIKSNTSFSAAVKDVVELRNKRSVWEVPSHPFPEAHFATFPPALILPCVLAGCPVGGTVLDPFTGAATTALVAKENGRKFIGFELNTEYCAMGARRLSQGVLDLHEAPTETEIPA